MKKLFVLLVSSFSIFSYAGLVAAADWPEKPIRYVMPFNGLPDVIARAYHHAVSRSLGQPIVPDYKLGVAGRLALGEIAKAEPNGYTIGMATSGPLTIHPNLYANLPYSSDKSFEIINIIGISPMALAVSATSNINSLDDLIALSKTREINIGTTGVGGPHHLAAVLLTKLGIPSVMIHYKGSSEAMPALVNGSIDAYFDTVYQQEVFVAQGRFRALAIATSKRMPQMPNVPTFGELGHPELIVETFYATVAPKGVPAPILRRLRLAYAEAAATPEVKSQMERLALLPFQKSPEELNEMVQKATIRWKKVIQDNKISAE